MKDFRIKKILMPTDLIDLAESAFKNAVAICKRQQADLTLLHVIDNYAFLASSEVLVSTIPLRPDYYKSIEDNINDLARKLSEQTNIKVEGLVKMGNPADMICNVAAENKHDLIVMGTHGASGLREFFIGSNAFSVVKHAPCPVLTVRGNWERESFNKIIFPVRLLPGSLDKYDYIKPIIEKNNSELLVLGLADSDKPSNVSDVAALTDQLKVRLQEEDIRFSARIIPNKDFATKVIEAAENADADLIVIIANLDHEWKEFFVGPFAQQIVNHSKRPVLSIRPEIGKVSYSHTSENMIKEASDKYLRFLL